MRRLTLLLVLAAIACSCGKSAPLSEEELRAAVDEKVRGRHVATRFDLIEAWPGESHSIEVPCFAWGFGEKLKKRQMMPYDIRFKISRHPARGLGVTAALASAGADERTFPVWALASEYAPPQPLKFDRQGLSFEETGRLTKDEVLRLLEQRGTRYRDRQRLLRSEDSKYELRIALTIDFDSRVRFSRRLPLPIKVQSYKPITQAFVVAVHRLDGRRMAIEIPTDKRCNEFWDERDSLD